MDDFIEEPEEIRPEESAEPRTESNDDAADSAETIAEYRPIDTGSFAETLIGNENPPEEPDSVDSDEERRPFFSIVKAFQSILTAAILVASLFTLFTPSNLFTDNLIAAMVSSGGDSAEEGQTAALAEEVDTERIGIVSGHWKDAENSGYICSDGLAENTLNLQIATLVSRRLTELGYQVDLLEEYDVRLTDYQALALVSIHNDTCEFISNDATGFKVGPALASAYPDEVNALSQCLIDAYHNATGLTYQTNKLTTDMTTYHSFNEVHGSTPTVIIETGYLNLDRQFLTQSTSKVVQGIVDGILCYVDPDRQEATAIP